MRMNLGAIIVLILAVIGLGMIAVAAMGLFQWFIDNFWVIILSGIVIFGLLVWFKGGKISRQDNKDF